MITAAAVLVVYVAAAMVGGIPQAGVFPDLASCKQAVARLEAQMVADGGGDGDMISGCYKVEVREPAVKS